MAAEGNPGNVTDEGIPAEIDVGLVPGNYQSYADDEIALQAEIDLLDPSGSFFEDEAFPADSRALYFDPLHPPKGALPGSSIKWSRISNGEVFECTKPKFISSRKPTSALITQGALGDSHLVNALRLMACRPEFVNRLLVSDNHKDRGIYTFKFYKAGSWRYVHIDDRVPTRQSGKVNFARNLDPNMTFAMLIEKAYAKLHGCYEALTHGLVEKTLLDLTPAACTTVLRNELLLLGSICDKTWNFLDESLQTNKLVGCGKFVPDPYSEKDHSRLGITVGHMYEVVDVQIASAAPTQDLDRLTVGMVCIRNLQKNEGFYTGPWSLGHQNWTLYREIGINLRHRTREIMHTRGLGKDPNEMDEDGNLVNFIKEDEFFDTKDRNAIDQFLALEQPDDPDVLHEAFLGRANLLSPQPYEKDIHWVQIEDFVDVFNRVYCVSDAAYHQKDSLGKHCQIDTVKFLSRWVPGDNLCGSAGPPLVLEEKVKRQDKMNQAQKERESKEKSLALLEANMPKSDSPANHNAANQAEAKGGDLQITSVPVTRDAPGEDTTSTGAGLVIYEPQDSDDEKETPTGNREGTASEAPSGTQAESKVEDETIVSDLGPYGNAEVNENFADNPTYPFGVMEPTTLCITLYQPDRRWSVGRLGEDARDITSSKFASRRERLASCMDYKDTAIGFVVVKLFGLKHRCTEFKLRKVVAASESLTFTNAATCAVYLLPGRYAVIPYTDTILDEAKDYILHFHFKKTSVELEVKDVLLDRLVDDDISDDESEQEEEIEIPSDEEDEEKIESMMKAHARQSMLAKFNSLKCKPPLPWTPFEWEYLEHTEELGVATVFDEVGDLARYMNTLSVEMSKLKHTIENLRLYTAPSPTEDDAYENRSKSGHSNSLKKPSSRSGGRKSPSRK